MKYYIEYIKENLGQSKLDGKHGFFMFLKFIDDMQMTFIKTSNYHNIGKYQYFFTTEHIRKKDHFLGYFRDSLSLQKTCQAAKQLKDERISFYFGIKNNILEYGFQDDMKRDIYKTGSFQVNTRYVRSLKSYKCLSLIENILKNSNLGNLNLLQQIKIHLKGWYEGKGNVVILSENIVKKTIDKNTIKEDAKDSNALLRKYDNWCEKFKWYEKVYHYIDNEEENEVTFYIKIKPKINAEEV
jgi:hypothetical protein